MARGNRCDFKIREELGELTAAIDAQNIDEVEEELGDLLSVVNLARFRKIDPEVLMAAANKKFEQRFGAMEQDLKAVGKSPNKRHSEKWKTRG